MEKEIEDLTQSFINSCYVYYKGNLYATNTNRMVKVGWIGDKGYVKVSKCGRQFRAHRLIWIMHNGPIPAGMYIDHIDNVKHNNLLSNLRLATKTNNNCNVAKRKDNTTGLKGVSSARKGKVWRAQINVNKKRIHLGYFTTPELASSVYNAAVLTYHTSFANVG